MSEKYATVVERAIQDFDRIFNALVKKKVIYNPNNETITNEENYILQPGDRRRAKDNNPIKTETYADLIEGQLFRIRNAGSLSVDTVVNYYTKSNLKNVGFTYTDSTLKISGQISNTGYYNEGSEISNTISTTTVNISGNSLTSTNYDNITVEEVVGNNENEIYRIRPTSNARIIGEINIDKGWLRKEADELNTTGVTLSSSLDLNVPNKTNPENISLTAVTPSSAFDTTNKFQIWIRGTSQLSGTMTYQTGGFSFKAGYIENIDGVEENNNNNNTNEFNLNLGDGNGNNVYVVEIPVNTNTDITIGDDGEDYYVANAKDNEVIIAANTYNKDPVKLTIKTNIIGDDSALEMRNLKNRLLGIN